MGQKVHPYAFRLGYIKNWNSRWFSKKREFPQLLVEDAKIRKFIKKSLAQAAVSKVEIERASNRIRVLIFTARPGIIIGRRGSEVDRLKEQLQNMTNNKQIFIDIKEISSPQKEAQLVAENIAYQLERRIAFRRAMKKTAQNAIQAGAGGIKILCSGRLGGSEIARKEKYKYGKIPLQTLRADIDYGFTEAHTTYGLIGIKVWIYKGEILPTVEAKGEVKNGVNAKKGKV